MHQKYINICDHRLYLSLVNKLLIFLIILFPTLSNAEWINSEGSEYIDRKTTIDEACKNALMKAKRNALSKANLERLQSNQIQICSENKVSSDCKLFESTFDYIEGGFINEIRIKKEKRAGKQLLTQNPLTNV